ncbi:MAG: SDR family NAD(P)-dependent oxidoreductase [Odoribacteraceae bacterium]|jgi:short-subunit dehydrogenase|nr:SDR family NAD(P)-dependent oxidoreductase [Odoribacteraceae bacterium]
MRRQTSPRKIIIIGATSGIGRELALLYLSSGHFVGITGRRAEKLAEIQALCPDRTWCKPMDVRLEESTALLDELIREMQGVDLIIYSSGIGTQTAALLPEVEMDTLFTNAVGFTRIVIHAYNYFKERRVAGHIAAISSIAGTKPLGEAPAYSATKRYVTHYISCLAQKARREKIPVTFTTILPGFIRTELLRHDYPLMIPLAKGARLIFRAIERKKRSTILPGRWRPIMFIARLIPRWLWERV